MNQAQRTYIKKRVEGILNEKSIKARTRYTTKGVTLTNRERLDLIRSGGVKLRSSLELNKLSEYSLSSISTVFDFDKFETKQSFDQDSYSKVVVKLKAKANEITDKVMLGDAEEALRMIKEFETFEC